MEKLTMIAKVFGSYIQLFEWHVASKASWAFTDGNKQTVPQNPIVLSEFNTSSMRINIEKLMTLLMRWEFVMRHANRF